MQYWLHTKSRLQAADNFQHCVRVRVIRLLKEIKVMRRKVLRRKMMMMMMMIVHSWSTQMMMMIVHNWSTQMMMMAMATVMVMVMVTVMVMVMVMVSKQTSNNIYLLQRNKLEEENMFIYVYGRE